MENSLTIFTPAYNREKYLPRLYESLQRQTRKDFEWIIVDDDSQDNTESLVESFLPEKEFSVSYIKQNHGGKHRAINKAVALAQGSYFFIVDSDDYLTDNAVELVYRWIEDISGEEMLAGVSGLRISKSGKIWGGRKAKKWVDASNFERFQYGLLGDKAEVYKTEILKQYPFPEFDGEYFVTEAVCWNSIAAAGYKLRWYNEPIYICDYLEDGLTNAGANGLEGHRKNYQGYLYYVKQSMKILPAFEKVSVFREYNKTSKAIGKTIRERAGEIDENILSYLLFLTVKMPVIYLGKLCYYLLHK